MGKTKEPAAVKLITGFIYKDRLAFDKAKALMIRRHGALDYESKELDFSPYTDYYKEEMGEGLKRRFVSFKKLIRAQSLSSVKISANRIENRLSVRNKRLVNIDPGYLEMAKITLASTKDFSHRIYLNKGIFAEITLIFRNKSFQPLEWTYPDYRSSEYLGIFNQIRDIYASQTIG